MKAARLIAAIIGIAILAGATGADAGVKWADGTWDEVLAQAKAENKYVFIDFYAVWCGPCKRMDETTFQTDGVVEFLNANVPVKLDAEKGLGEKLADKYRIHSYPTFMLIGPDGTEVDRHIGYLEEADFLEIMNGYIEGKWTVAWYEEKLKANPDDLEMLVKLGTKHVDAVRPAGAEKALNRVLELDPNDEHGHKAEIIYNLGDVNYSAEKYPAAVTYFERLIDAFPEGEWYERGLRRVASAYYKVDRANDAVASYKKYLDLHPDDPGAMNAFAWFCSQRAIGLDLALPVALKAAELSNRDAGILDTLAEVYFAMGSYDEAITVMKECIESDPEDKYFKGQLEKYQTAKAEATGQASR